LRNGGLDHHDEGGDSRADSIVIAQPVFDECSIPCSPARAGRDDPTRDEARPAPGATGRAAPARVE
jgi:hypothetical protein